MANTLLIKRRIKTAQNVSKTTKAMQMIAASKMKRAQDTTLASRPYVDRITIISKSLSAKLEDESLHPYMIKPDDSKKSLLIAISSDKGLCGGMITNLLKEYFKFKDDKNIISIAIGKKIENHVARSKNELVASFPFGTSLPQFDIIYPISKIINDYYLSKKINSVKVLYTHFVSVFSQKPMVKTLLPVDISLETPQEPTSNHFQLFEPSITEILPTLLKRYLEISLYQLLLENFVSEQAARMIAMQNATDNARDIIAYLTLEYNKARQARITSEILDIASSSNTVYE